MCENKHDAKNQEVARTADIDLKASTELSTQVEALSISPLDLPETQFKEALARRQKNRHILLHWIASSLKENVDFGSIPTKRGPSKPSLWKPGAEKILGMLGVVAHFTIPSGDEFDHIIIQCYLCDSQNRTLAHGLGARTLKQDGNNINTAIKTGQ